MSFGNKLTHQELLDFLISEYNHPFSGWDFSYIADRMVSEPLPWSYASKVLMKMRKVVSLLDMGTGGGEFLYALQPLPKYTAAIEGYKPNIPIARRSLEPIGVKVYEFTDENNLPFEDSGFELIINRHESYSPKEVLRILKPGCQFITQQVGELNDSDLAILLGAEEHIVKRGWNLKSAIRELEQQGFQIPEQKEAFPLTRFYDVGAIVYYLKAVPWAIPDFSVSKYFDSFLETNSRIRKEGYVAVRNHRFFLISRKPS